MTQPPQHGSPMPIPLEYGTPPRRDRRVRLVLAIALALVIVIAGWQFGPTLWRGTKAYYIQQQALHYSPSPDLVVFEQATAPMMRLRHEPGYTMYQMGNAMPSVRYQPPQLRNLIQSVSTVSYPDASIPNCIAFLGELLTPTTHEQRLVFVLWDGLVTKPAGPVRRTIVAYTIKPRGLLEPLRLTVHLGGFMNTWPTVGAMEASERVFAGQVDPADASHFTIRYQLWGQEDIIDGRMNDQFQVLLAQRNRPTTRPLRLPTDR